MKNLQRPIYCNLFGPGGGGPAGAAMFDKDGNPNTTASGDPAANVGLSIIPDGVHQNRVCNIQLVHPGTDATNAITFTTGEDIHYVVIPPETKYIINQADGAAAKVDLDAVANISLTRLHGEAYAEPVVFAQKTPITRVDFKATVAANTTAGIEAWS